MAYPGFARVQFLFGYLLNLPWTISQYEPNDRFFYSNRPSRSRVLASLTNSIWFFFYIKKIIINKCIHNLKKWCNKLSIPIHSFPWLRTVKKQHGYSFKTIVFPYTGHRQLILYDTYVTHLLNQSTRHRFFQGFSIMDRCCHKCFSRPVTYASRFICVELVGPCRKRERSRFFYLKLIDDS